MSANATSDGAVFAASIVTNASTANTATPPTATVANATIHFQ